MSFNGIWARLIYLRYKTEKLAVKVLTISVRQATVAAQRTRTFQYGRPLERDS